MSIRHFVAAARLRNAALQAGMPEGMIVAPWLVLNQVDSFGHTAVSLAVVAVSVLVGMRGVDTASPSAGRQDQRSIVVGQHPDR